MKKLFENLKQKVKLFFLPKNHLIRFNEHLLKRNLCYRYDPSILEWWISMYVNVPDKKDPTRFFLQSIKNKRVICCLGDRDADLKEFDDCRFTIFTEHTKEGTSYFLRNSNPFQVVLSYPKFTVIKNTGKQMYRTPVSHLKLAPGEFTLMVMVWE